MNFKSIIYTFLFLAMLLVLSPMFYMCYKQGAP